MSSNDYNKVITTVNSVTSDYSLVLGNPNDCIVIDTSNNRLGINTSDPQYEIDVSGTIQTKSLVVLNDASFNDASFNNFDISGVSGRDMIQRINSILKILTDISNNVTYAWSISVPPSL